ncbi:hypothetical protein N7462_004169 [Penicillium macrosclerotiorum]|uniref:uncharacterized protein n=1 Tax=Penicillium macrosclerotiorum TaxID=303699 RepID=UPI002548EB34|nr:uncharacterized protein N7462_004169 [Penicillium macrosclerotiorum]KAJ5689777.1 hypothetical protein N7462_004169 [Penicillium macrosclerotiorum]
MAIVVLFVLPQTSDRNLMGSPQSDVEWRQLIDNHAIESPGERGEEGQEGRGREDNGMLGGAHRGNGGWIRSDSYMQTFSIYGWDQDPKSMKNAAPTDSHYLLAFLITHAGSLTGSPVVFDS